MLLLSGSDTAGHGLGHIPTQGANALAGTQFHLHILHPVPISWLDGASSHLAFLASCEMLPGQKSGLGKTSATCESMPVRGHLNPHLPPSYVSSTCCFTLTNIVSPTFSLDPRHSLTCPFTWPLSRGLPWVQRMCPEHLG